MVPDMKVRKGALISIFGIEITLGGLLLIVAYLLQTALMLAAALILQDKMKEMKALASLLG